MAKLGINTGTTPNDNTGDSLLDGAVKVNTNFNELYSLLGDGNTLSVGVVTAITAGSGINVNSASGNVTVTNTGIAETANIKADTVTVSGIVTATSFSGTVPSSSLSGALPALDGSALTGVTGSGIDIKHDGSTVGTAGTINFSTNLDVTAIHSGIVTVTASGGSGITTENVVTDSLVVAGVSTFNGASNFNSAINVADNVVANFGASLDGRISYTSSTDRFYVRTPGGTADLILGAGTAIRITNENGLTDRAVFTASGATITGTLTAGGLTYPTSNGTSGYVLTSDGAGNVSWTAGGLQSRATTSVTQSIVNGASADVSITAPSGYALLSIETSHAAWVTLYSDTSSRTLDAPRAITNDPLPGSGVLAEVITTGAATQKVTPGIICFNSAGAGQNTTYAKIENRSGSTNNITVTLTYITLEA